MSTFKLGTRGSQLALYQANTTASLLKTHAGIDCEIVVIKTSGDRLAEAPLSEIGGKRLFVKEIEDSLLAGEIDLAVHSSKDLPAILPPGTRLSFPPVATHRVLTRSEHSSDPHRQSGPAASGALLS